MLRSLLIVVVLGLICIPFGSAQAQVPGVHYLGLPAASGAEVDALAATLNQSGNGTFAVSVLYEFNPTSPYANLSRLIREVAPHRPLQPRLYLKYDHTFVNNLNGGPFWIAWQSSNPTPAETKIRNDFMFRVNIAAKFVSDTQQWLRNNKHPTLNWVIVGELEDTCPPGRQAAFARMASAIQSAISNVHATNVTVCRSCVGNNIFRPAGVSLELHGARWADVRAKLVAGDTYCNDGYEFQDVKTLLTDENAALDASINFLDWTGDFNGSPKSKTPDQRLVNALTGKNGQSIASTIAHVSRAK